MLYFQEAELARLEGRMAGFNRAKMELATNSLANSTLYSTLTQSQANSTLLNSMAQSQGSTFSHPHGGVGSQAANSTLFSSMAQSEGNTTNFVQPRGGTCVIKVLCPFKCPKYLSQCVLPSFPCSYICLCVF